MPTYYYVNTLGSKVSTTTAINLCSVDGPMSICTAFEIKDQHGCKYRRDASHKDCCMYLREDMGNACDNPWAQKGIDPPKEE